MACMETPSRPAVSRSTLHHRAQAAVLGLRDDLAQHRRGAQLLGELGRPGRDVVGVAADQRVLVLRAADARADLDVLHRLEVDGDAGDGADRCPAGARRSAVTLALRASRGLSVILRWPALGVGLSALTPTTVTTPSTSGSLRMASATVSCRRCHLGEGDLGARLHHRRDEAGVLQRQEALGHDHVEADGDDQRGEPSSAAWRARGAAPTRGCGGSRR